MDWDHAIKRNSEVLAGIVADLFVMLGLVGDATVSRISWPAYRAVLRILRPAESTLRRLIVVAARSVVIAPAVARPKRAGAVKPEKRGTSRPGPPSFLTRRPVSCCRAAKSQAGCPPHPLFQYRWRVYNHRVAESVRQKPPLPPGPNPLTGWSMPPALSAGSKPLRPPWQTFPARPNDWCAGGCGRRSQKTPVSKPRSGGRPPGHRRRNTHLVDELLSECDWLALRAAMTDTS